MSEDPEARGEIKRDGRARVRPNSKHDSFLPFLKKKSLSQIFNRTKLHKKGSRNIHIFFT